MNIFSNFTETTEALTPHMKPSLEAFNQSSGEELSFISCLLSKREASFPLSALLPWAFCSPYQGVSPTPLGQSQPWKALLLACSLAREETACWPKLIRDDYCFISIPNLMLIVNTIFPPLNESPALLNIDIWKCTLVNLSINVKTIGSKTLFLILGSANLT